MTCTRSGARAATSWPPRWARDSPKGRGGRGGAGAGAAASKGHHHNNNNNNNNHNHHHHQPGVHQFGQSPVTPLHPPSSRASSQRSVSPDRGRAGDRSRSRSPSSLSESSAGASSASAADWATYQSLVTTNLAHLPAGRFVYGRRYLQPFEFSAFWHSAETNRAGARAARCEDTGDGDSRGGQTSEKIGGQTSWSSSSSVATGDASFGTAARRRRNGGGGGGGSFWGGGGGSRSGAGEWRRREDGRGAGPPTPPPPGFASDASRRSPPMPVPCAKPRESHGATWPGFDEKTRATKKHAWVPRGRWTNERRVNEALEAVPPVAGDVDDALARTSLGSPKRNHGSPAQARTSELTRALSQPSALASH